MFFFLIQAKTLGNNDEGMQKPRSYRGRCPAPLCEPLLLGEADHAVARRRDEANEKEEEGGREEEKVHVCESVNYIQPQEGRSSSEPQSRTRKTKNPMVC